MQETGTHDEAFAEKQDGLLQAATIDGTLNGDYDVPDPRYPAHIFGDDGEPVRFVGSSDSL